MHGTSAASVAEREIDQSAVSLFFNPRPIQNPHQVSDV